MEETTVKKHGISPMRIRRALASARAAVNCNDGNEMKAIEWLERDIERQYREHSEKLQAFKVGAPIPEPHTPVQIGDLVLAIKYLRNGAWKPLPEVVKN